MPRPTLAIYGIKDRNAFEYPAYVHDHNLCLMQDGKIIQYLQLERYSRRKYDNRLDLFIEELIDQKILGLTDEFDLISVNDFVGNAFVSQCGRIHFEADWQTELKFAAIPAHCWFQHHGWEGKELNSYLCQHETAHICSTIPFFGHFRDNSLLVSIDGGSSLGNYSAFIYKNGQISLIENNWTDLGFASKLFNDNALSFRMLGAAPGSHCSVPGKLMGFASWGHYSEDIEKWLRQNKYFKDYWNREGEILSDIEKTFGKKAAFDTHDPFMQDIAATMQHIFETAILNKLTALQEKYRADYLYYGGGCALNIVTNTKIIESGLFKDIFIAPCCNDSGLSVGAASLLEMQKGNIIQPHSPYLCNVGLGETQGAVSKAVSVSEIEIEKTAELLMRHKIVGVCNGPAETGPRALGSRSLIALADSRNLAQKLSMQVKKREWYRPVAPIMLKENAERAAEQRVRAISNYMLMDFTIRPEYRERMAGAVHANNTARIQTISCEADNPFIYKLLLYLYEKHGVPALINTSFNAQGEPIVHTAEEARASARRMELDGLVVNGRLEMV